MSRTTTRTTGAPTSVLSRAIPVADLKDEYVKMAIYGRNRVGKTTLACQFPKPLLLIGCEPTETGGASSVTQVPGVMFLRIDNTKDLLTLAAELGQKITPFKTVVVDSATSIQDIVLKEILDLPEIPNMLSWGTATMKDYQKRSEKTREVLRPFLNLKCHTVITAKEKDHNPPKDEPEIVRGVQLESFFSVDLGGQTAGWLQDACGSVCQLIMVKETTTKVVKVGSKSVQSEIETGRIIRRLRTQRHPNYESGLRSAYPEKVPEFIDEPTFDKIYAIIRGK